MMAFAGHQRKCAKSLTPTYQRQTGLDVGGGIKGNKTWSFLSIPGVSLQNQETTPYVPWFHNACDNTFDLINCLQNSSMNRKCTDNNSDGENDGLIPNIVNGAHSQDSYTDGCPSTLNPWSSKTLSRELMQCFQSEAKMQHNSNFSSNHEAFSKAHGQSRNKDVGEYSQQSADLTINQLVFNLANGDKNSHIQYAQKVPPGLPVPGVGDNLSADKERGKSHPVNNYSDFSDILRHQSPCFDPYYEDSYIQSSAKNISNSQFVPQGINQQGTCFESFTAGSFSNIHKQRLGTSLEDRLIEQWKFTGPLQSSSRTMQSQIKQVGDVGMMQRERNGVRKQILKCDTFQDNLLEDHQQLQPFCPVNLPNHHQSKMSIPRESLKLNTNQDVRHHILQSQIQNKVKPQMKGDAMGENSSHMKNGAIKKVFSRSQHFDLQGGSQSLRFEGENGMVNTGATQQCMPPIYPGGDFRGRSSLPNNFSSRSPLLNGDLHDRSTMNESAVFNSYVREMMINRVENTNHGRASLVMNKGGLVVQLYICVDECFEQWRCLERERKRIELILAKTFVRKRIGAASNTSPLKSPPNPSRVDHLLVRQIREQAKVASLLTWMEDLNNSPFPNISTVLNKQRMVIYFTQARREEEMANMSRHQQQEQRAYITEGRENLMIIALKELVATTRKLRTALWCALQMTLPKSDKRRESHGNKEDTFRDGCTSPFTGYYFK